MVKRPTIHPDPLEDGGSTPLASLHISPIEVARDRWKDDPVALAALKDFEANPKKCFQRHIREKRGEHDPHPPMGRDGWTIRPITNQEARQFIHKYEWLRSMGPGTIEAIGGYDKNGELFGVECFGKIGRRVGMICKGQTVEEDKFFASATAYLMRGACAPWAHKKAGSWLVRQACRHLYKTRKWQIFFAYSDSAAGEVGIIYQRAHWHYLGTGLGKGTNAKHTDYRRNSDGKILTSYAINHGREKIASELNAKRPAEALQISLERGKFRPSLLATGEWVEIVHPSHGKGKYVWFEGSSQEVAHLIERCKIRFKLSAFLKYPSRTNETN